jgi:glycosyltransferase involved in cell wall biosynthesis
MLVSFIIPAHNEELELPETLRAIANVAAELKLDHEVVVASDASTDATERIAAEAGAVVARHERRQISATRNLGWKASRGEVLFFIDADTRVSPGAVREALEAMRGGAVGGGGPMRFDGRLPLYARVLLPILNWKFRWRKLTGGAFLFAKRDALERAGGWSEDVFVAEELYLAQRLKEHGPFAIVRTPVVTSGRKLRTHSFGEMLGLLVRAGVHREKMFKDRRHLSLWYGERRPDPHRAGGGPGDKHR